jgi:hypothetical protein
MAFFTNTSVFALENKVSINDELLQYDSIKNSAQISKKKINTPIVDELLNTASYKDAPFKLNAYVNKYANPPIKDELLEDNLFKSKSKEPVISDKIVQDEYFIEKSIDLKKVRRIKPKTKYDFTKKQVPIKIKIAEQIKSTRQISEGSIIHFVAEHDFEINGKNYCSGTTILGRVETISASDKMGTPESIKISNFYIPEAQEIELYGSISKNGANRALWVYPLYQAGNILLYAAGFAVVPIHGGRVKLSPSESFTVFYETK